jgi:hypothetical protein
VSSVFENSFCIMKKLKMIKVYMKRHMTILYGSHSWLLNVELFSAVKYTVLFI